MFKRMDVKERNPSPLAQQLLKLWLPQRCNVPSRMWMLFGARNSGNGDSIWGSRKSNLLDATQNRNMRPLMLSNLGQSIIQLIIPSVQFMIITIDFPFVMWTPLFDNQ